MVYTTAALAVSAVEQGTVTMGKSWRLYSIQTDRAARVRLYDTVANRDADVARAIGTDPTSSAGVMFEFVAVAAGTITTSPLVEGANRETVPSTAIPISVTNTSAGVSPVVVTLLFAATE